MRVKSAEKLYKHSVLLIKAWCFYEGRVIVESLTPLVRKHLGELKLVSPVEEEVEGREEYSPSSRRGPPRHLMSSRLIRMCHRITDDHRLILVVFFLSANVGDQAVRRDVHCINPTFVVYVNQLKMGLQVALDPLSQMLFFKTNDGFKLLMVLVERPMLLQTSLTS
ncbi:hypothetical protein ACFE04_004772 [Oxalis oulophora]